MASNLDCPHNVCFGDLAILLDFSVFSKKNLDVKKIKRTLNSQFYSEVMSETQGLQICPPKLTAQTLSVSETRRFFLIFHQKNNVKK